MNPLASTKCAGRLLMALAAITAILLMAACGSSSSRPAPNPQGFNDGSLTGTYVISISGTDVNTSINPAPIVPFAIAGTIAANGKGGITGGTVDINDPGNLGVQIGQAVVSSSSGYQVGQDGRGSGKLVVASGATFNFDFVLMSASHGLISRFDSFGTGSGTIDIQTPVTSLTGSYAFSLSGTDSGGNFNPLGTVGAFTLSSNSITGTEDFNDDLTSGPGFTGLPLTGQVVLGAGGTSATAHFINTSVVDASLASLNFNVWVIDSTHLKFIETDTADTGVLLAGDAFTQVTSIAAGQLVFVLSGLDGSGNPVAAGGYATATDANGDLTNGFEDYNNAGVVGSLKPFSTTSATCVTATGRCQLALNGFSNGASQPFVFAVYPSSGGGLAMEIDSFGLLQGASYSQSATSFTASGGYALNLTGQNTGQGGEVDDIAQFDAGAPDTSFTGPLNMTGSLDENDLGTLLTTTSSLKGIYVPDTAPDGRGSISSTNSGTLLGGFTLQYYVVDSSTVVFIDVDSFALDGSVAQVAVGTFQAQGASGSAAAQSRMAIVHPAVRAHGALRSK